MWGSISAGWNITKQSLRALKEDKEIVIFPILSILLTLAVTAAFVVALYTGYLGIFLVSEDIFNYYIFAIGIIYTFTVYIISSFFQAAIITSATIRFGGKNPSLGDGLSGPLRITHKIILWAVISTIASLILNGIRNALGKRGLGGLGAGLLGVAWGLLTFFVIPIMLFEKKGMLDSIKRSKELFAKTWGENITAQIATGGVFVIAAIFGVIPFLASVFLNISWFVIPSLILFALWFCVLIVLATSVDGIVKAALYSYAVNGKMPEIYDEETARAMTRKASQITKK